MVSLTPLTYGDTWQRPHILRPRPTVLGAAFPGAPIIASCQSTSCGDCAAVGLQELLFAWSEQPGAQHSLWPVQPLEASLGSVPGSLKGQATRPVSTLFLSTLNLRNTPAMQEQMQIPTLLASQAGHFWPGCPFQNPYKYCCIRK